jgi:hypothetical protein
MKHSTPARSLNESAFFLLSSPTPLLSFPYLAAGTGSPEEDSGRVCHPGLGRLGQPNKPRLG